MWKYGFKIIRLELHLEGQSINAQKLLWDINLSTNFRGLQLKVEEPPSCLKHVHTFICDHEEANASCCLLQTMLLGFGLGRRI